MTIVRAFLIIGLSGVVGLLGGGMLGYFLAVVTPGYYRGLFATGREPWFDPVAVGLGLGVTQGLIIGLIVGAIVVLSVALYISRRSAWGMEFPGSKAPTLPPDHKPYAEGDTGVTNRPRR